MAEVLEELYSMEIIDNFQNTGNFFFVLEELYSMEIKNYSDLLLIISLFQKNFIVWKLICGNTISSVYLGFRRTLQYGNLEYQNLESYTQLCFRRTLQYGNEIQHLDLHHGRGVLEELYSMEISLVMIFLHQFQMFQKNFIVWKLH